MEDIVEHQSGEIVSKETVIRISPEKIHPDPDFPSIDVEVIDKERMPFMFAKQITDYSKEEDKWFSQATKFLGRGVFSEPGIILTTKDDKKSITSILTKSTGVPNAVRVVWPEYEGKPVFFLSKEEKGDERRSGLMRRPGFAGLSVKQDQILDAEKSVKLRTLGAKTRIPLAAWTVDSFSVFDSASGTSIERDIAWFKKQGYEGDELYQSAWGMSCPLRVEDVNDFLVNTIQKKLKLGEVENFLRSMVVLAEADMAIEYQNIVTKWKERLHERNNLNQDECADLLEDFALALCRTMGKNYDILFKNNLTHGNLHDQNISFFGELCDNSLVQTGLLEIGLAPENSADIAGFKLALRKLGSVVFHLRGLDAFEDSIAFGDYLNNKFFREVRNSWLTYNEFCEERWNSDVRKVLEDSRVEITDRLKESYGESEITEAMIRKGAQRRLGSKEWPFGKI